MLLSRIVKGFSFSILLMACHEIVGIEDREFSLCGEYCDTVAIACVEGNAIYPMLKSEKDTCLGVCSKLPQGNRLEPGRANDIACRLDQANTALEYVQDDSMREAQTHCQAAGLGGNETCGEGPCESYCLVLEATCPAEYGETWDCESTCAGFSDAGPQGLFENGNTLQCRLRHLANATVDPVTHCKHAMAVPNGPCADKAETVPTCADFCKLSLAVCQDDYKVFESSAQCMAVCEVLDPGAHVDKTGNTAACRMYHTYNSIKSPEQHCSHTGPGGDGHCGEDDEDATGNCRAYCALLAASPCESELAADEEACLAECAGVPGAELDSGYSVSAAAGTNTVGCRLLNVARALDGDPEACEAALGGGECE